MVAVLAIIAFYFLIYPAWRAHFLIEIWPTEGWNAYFQDMAAAGRNIYPASDSLIVNNYPPLSFYAVGLLSRIFGDSLFVGRVLSLLALIVVSVEIFFCIRALGGRMASGAIGALWYVAIMSHHFTSYVGVNDPQLAGEAIMGAGLVLFLVRENSGGSPLAPLLIMVIGGFWKHNMIAIPLTAIIWLLARRGRQSWGVVAISAATTIGGLAACRAIFGAAFFSNLFAVRQYSLGHLISQIGTLQWCALAFIIWLSWAIRSRTMTARFTLLYVAISLASCLLQWCGDDVFGSAELDLMIALGIATGIAFESINSPPRRLLGTNGSKVVVVALLALRLLAGSRQEPLLVLFSPAFRDHFEVAERATVEEAVEVAGIPGAVYCTVKIVCRMAGKPFVVDDFKIDELLATHEVSRSQLAELIRSRHITTFRCSPLVVDGSIFDALRATVPER